MSTRLVSLLIEIICFSSGLGTDLAPSVSHEHFHVSLDSRLKVADSYTVNVLDKCRDLV